MKVAISTFLINIHLWQRLDSHTVIMQMPSSYRLRLSNNCLANTMQLSGSPYAVIWQLSESYLGVKRLLCGNWYVVSHQRVKQSSNHRWVSSDSYLAIISQSPRNSQADNILNMSYLTDSYIVFTLKIESVLLVATVGF